MLPSPSPMLPAPSPKLPCPPPCAQLPRRRPTPAIQGVCSWHKDTCYDGPGEMGRTHYLGGLYVTTKSNLLRAGTRQQKPRWPCQMLQGLFKVYPKSLWHKQYWLGNTMHRWQRLAPIYTLGYKHLRNTADRGSEPEASRLQGEDSPPGNLPKMWANLRIRFGLRSHLRRH
jgi:hypothetical protein